MEVTSDINSIVAELLQSYKDELKNSGHDASGKLSSTAKYKVTFNGKWFEVSFILQDYWRYLENGTKPHWPPTDEIERWVTVKRIIPSAYNGKVPTTKQLAYMIARGISRNGTKATKLLQNTIDSSTDLINKLVDSIYSQIKNETDEEIDNSL